MPTVLVVEDDASGRKALVSALTASGLTVFEADSGEEAVARLKLTPVDVVLSDVMMGRMTGLDLLAHVQTHYADTAVILVTGHGTISSAVDAMRAGAYDYLTKPVDLDHLELLLERALGERSLLRENRQLRGQLQGKYLASGIVVRSQPMQRVLRHVEQVAPTNASVLIRGESGTGKELIASAIHYHSQRADKPFVKVNCAALPETLVESELFGHERGAFTGAVRTRRGRFELAHGGTLFLDEVGDLTLSTQIKLLRAVQERSFERVGGQIPIEVDVRLLTATNRDLEEAMEEGRFREELYYRLKVVTVDVPPLRERPDDIPALLNHFLSFYANEHRRPVTSFDDRALDRLCQYEWPGNVRELRNLVESLVVTARGPAVLVADLPASVVARPRQPHFAARLGRPLEEVERAYVLQTLEALGGNKTRAAQILGIGKKTLYRRLESWGNGWVTAGGAVVDES